MTETTLPERRELHFTSGTDRCHAWIYMPPAADTGRPPMIVMAHGLGAVKALRLGAFAERFRAAGYACLVFDYRHFGDSDGEPRELLSISRQRQDWRAAVAFARSLPDIDRDRIVLWGTSFGGGHAIVTPPMTVMWSRQSRSVPSPTVRPRPGKSPRAEPRD